MQNGAGSDIRGPEAPAGVMRGLLPAPLVQVQRGGLPMASRRSRLSLSQEPLGPRCTPESYADFLRPFLGSSFHACQNDANASSISAAFDSPMPAKSVNCLPLRDQLAIAPSVIMPAS